MRFDWFTVVSVMLGALISPSPRSWREVGVRRAGSALGVHLIRSRNVRFLPDHCTPPRAGYVGMFIVSRTPLLLYVY